MERTPPEGPGITRLPKPHENPCPDGRHRIRIAVNAAPGFDALPPSLRERLVEMLCDVAEVAELAPDAVDFRRRDGTLSLRVGRRVALCSVDAAHAVTVHHVIEPEALPRIA